MDQLTELLRLTREKVIAEKTRAEIEKNHADNISELMLTAKDIYELVSSCAVRDGTMVGNIYDHMTSENKKSLERLHARIDKLSSIIQTNSDRLLNLENSDKNIRRVCDDIDEHKRRHDDNITSVNDKVNGISERLTALETTMREVHGLAQRSEVRFNAFLWKYLPILGAFGLISALIMWMVKAGNPA